MIMVENCFISNECIGKGPTVEKPVVICHFPLLYPILPNKKKKLFVCSSISFERVHFQWLSHFTPSVPFHPARCPTSPRAVPSHPKIKGFENHLLHKMT